MAKNASLTVWLALVTMATALNALPSAFAFRCFGFSNELSGEIVPFTDIELAVNDSYSAICNFNSSEISAEDVQFINAKAGQNFTSEILNSSSIRIVRTEPLPTRYTLRCRSKTYKSICERRVSVGFPPLDFKEFACVSKNWETLNCSWMLPNNYVHTTYEVKFAYNGGKIMSLCPKSVSSRTNCFIGENTKPHFRRVQQIRFAISAVNSLGNETFNKVINLYEWAEVNGSTSIILKWSLSHTMGVFPKVIHEISFKGKWEKVWTAEQKIYTNGIHDPFDSYHVHSINSLYPYSTYEFRVRLHTGYGDIREEMWSDYALTEAVTLPAVPSVAVNTTRAAFEVSDTSYDRKVFIFWQKIDKYYENAIGYHYDIDVFEGLKNSEGKNSSLVSEILLPEKAIMPSLPEMFTAITEQEDNEGLKDVRVIWQPPLQKAQEVISYTLFWCRKSSDENRCYNEKLHWVTLDNTDKLHIHLAKQPSVIYLQHNLSLLADQFYKYGIAANTRTSSSGIKWAQCVVTPGEWIAKPEIKYNFSTSSSITISWIVECSAKSAILTGYNISFCEVQNDLQKTCLKNETNYVAIDNPNALNYEIKNLHPATSYLVSFAFHSIIGQSKWSELARIMTLEGIPSSNPQNLVAEEVTSNSISVRWDPPPPRDRNGVITKYLIKIGDKAPREANLTYFDFLKLDPYSIYDISVVACTQVGCGTTEAVLSVATKAGVPDEVAFRVDEYDGRLIVENNTDSCNGPKCDYYLVVNFEDDTASIDRFLNKSVLDLKEDLGIDCINQTVAVSVRAIGYDENEQPIYGPLSEEMVSCKPPGSVLAWWKIALVCLGCLALFSLLCYLLKRTKRDFMDPFRKDLNKELNVPGDIIRASGDDISFKIVNGKLPKVPEKPKDAVGANFGEAKEDKVLGDESKNRKTSVSSEEEKLIQDNIENRHGRLPSGESGQSSDTGCSSGVEFNSSSSTEGGYVTVGTNDENRSQVTSANPKFSENLRSLSSSKDLNALQNMPSRASTGYFSIGENEDYPPYSRYGYGPGKYKSLPGLCSLKPTTRMPKTNTGYVSVGETRFGVKPQSSLPDFSKSEENHISESHPTPYCKVGKVGITVFPPDQEIESEINANHEQPQSSNVEKCIPNSNSVSPYVAPGMCNKWAQRVFHPKNVEEGRISNSAPVESHKFRSNEPSRPNTSDVISRHNKMPNVQHQQSLQSSGYVSQTSMADTQGLSPKKLIANTREPYVSVFTSNHQVSMV